MKDIEKYLLEDEDNSENTLLDEKSEQLFENQSTLEIKTQMDNAFDNVSSLPLAQTIQSPNSNNSYYNYNNSEITNTTSNLTTINHRSNTHQTNQPVHHRLFNNNYGMNLLIYIDIMEYNILIKCFFIMRLKIFFESFIKLLF